MKDLGVAKQILSMRIPRDNSNGTLNFFTDRVCEKDSQLVQHE